jgi:hypothetical protein
MSHNRSHIAPARNAGVVTSLSEGAAMPRLAAAAAASASSPAKTRRAFMRTVASVASVSVIAPSIAAAAAPAVLAAPADEALVELRADVETAHKELAAARDRLDLAESIMREWTRRNPKPKQREVTVGTGAEYEAWFKQFAEAKDPADVTLPDPNADLKAAIGELHIAFKSWRQRKATAENKCGLADAKAAESAADEKFNSALERVTEATPRTFAGLAIKARVASKYGDEDFLAAVIDDLLGMAEAVDSPSENFAGAAEIA